MEVGGGIVPALHLTPGLLYQVGVICSHGLFCLLWCLRALLSISGQDHPHPATKVSNAALFPVLRSPKVDCGAYNLLGLLRDPVVVSEFPLRWLQNLLLDGREEVFLA